MIRRILLLAALAVGSLLIFSACACAAPIWKIEVQQSPSNFPHDSGLYWFDVSNFGNSGSSGPVSLTIELPPGELAREEVLNHIGRAATGPDPTWTCPGGVGQTTITCTTSEPIPRHSVMGTFGIKVGVFPAASGEPLVTATVSGGGAVAAATTSLATKISDTPDPFGVTPGSWIGDFYGPDGLTPVRQAGAHPYEARFSFDLNSVASPIDGNPLATSPSGSLRDVRVELPPGFVGDPTAVAACSPSQLLAEACPAASQVGRVDVRLVSPSVGNGAAFDLHSQAVYNMVHPKGAVTDLAFLVSGNPVHILASLDPADNYSIDTTVSDVNETIAPFTSVVTIWGLPKDSGHDSERCGGPGISTGSLCPSAGSDKAFLTVPPSCGGSEKATLADYDSWQESGVFGPPVPYELPGQFTGCAQTQAEFRPSIAVTPTNTHADSPTGLTIEASVPQNSDPEGVAVPPVKRIHVALPEGMTLNPAFASGLEACSEAELGISHAAVPDQSPVACPEGSRIGNLEISTPVLPEPLQGSIYLATQTANPESSLFAIYAVVHDTEERGILLKIPGRLDLDPSTGRITTDFEDLPELPFEHLTAQFRGGERAPLVNPPTCGTAMASGALDTWAAPATEVPIEGSYAVAAGAGNGSCPSSSANRAFGPAASAGTQTPRAGAFSPFVLRVTRQDGEAEISTLTADLPPGLLAKLAGVAECSDLTLAAIPTAPATGKPQLEHPSCPANSLVGYTNVGAGAGPEPFYIHGDVYLAGPYKGAPQSLAIVTPAVAGPFDLGTVVVRAALYVDEYDAQVKAVSDPIPSIIQGVKLHIRDIRVVANRPNFTLNPTNCNPLQVAGQLASTAGGIAGFIDPFQVGECGRLAFKPKVKIQLKGGTKRLALPVLKATVTYPQGGGYANIARAQVSLPDSEFLEQNNVAQACTKVILAAHACPAKSIYGKAKAWSPLLEKPLEGPVYLVGGYGYKLPAMVAELNGQIRILLVGKIDTGSNKGIRATFESVPDAPVEKFTLELKGGKKYGLLINSESICKKPQKAIARFTAQDGTVVQTKPLIANQCGKPKKKSRGKKKGGKGDGQGGKATKPGSGAHRSHK